MKKIINLVLAAILIALIIFTFIIINRRDSVPPSIEFAAGEIVYNEGDSESVLLQYIKATDDKDGDVTASIMIEQTVVSDLNNSMIVYYAAKDSSNNVTKANRTVTYVPSEKEEGEKYRIMMINNLGVENLATVWSRRLTAEGHTVTAIGLSNDPISAKTVIYVSEEGKGEELLEFFPEAEIKIGSREGEINVNDNGANVYIVFGMNDSELPE